jgi:transposase
MTWATSGSAFATCWPQTRSWRKKRSLRRQIQALPARTALLAEDETDLLLFPPLRAGWARRGEPAPVPISGFNARRTLFGTLNVRTGHALFLEEKRRRAEEFQGFLELIHWHYRAWPVALLLDENSIHTAQGSQRLVEELGIRLLWLPKRSPHLNPMDHLWRHGKAVVCANHQYAALDEEVCRFTDYLQSLSPKERLRKAGVLSKNLWLQLRH